MSSSTYLNTLREHQALLRDALAHGQDTLQAANDLATWVHDAASDHNPDNDVTDDRFWMLVTSLDPLLTQYHKQLWSIGLQFVEKPIVILQDRLGDIVLHGTDVDLTK